MKFLTDVWHWMAAHPAAATAIVAGLISILNAATTIWSDHPKAIKWFTFIISILSVIRSRGEATKPGILGALKFPLVPEVSSRPASPDVNSTTGAITSALFPFALVSLLASGCPATTGQNQFDPATALNTACALEPALNTIVTAGVCDNLKEPAKTTCLKVAAIAHVIAPAILAGVGAIYDTCRGATPRSLTPPKAEPKTVTPASKPVLPPPPLQDKMKDKAPVK